ncbi:MAG: cysteine--tRNA ligase, partial [Butyrivibrio sp.]|nr:cysteine--tRNA ligase [Butyrivibrio sp.]
LALVESFDKVLSLDLIGHAKMLGEGVADVDPELLKYIEEQIAKRTEAKKNKDFATADAIRDELMQRGIEIKDTREGVKWQIV